MLFRFSFVSHREKPKQTKNASLQKFWKLPPQLIYEIILRQERKKTQEKDLGSYNWNLIFNMEKPHNWCSLIIVIVWLFGVTKQDQAETERLNFFERTSRKTQNCFMVCIKDMQPVINWAEQGREYWVCTKMCSVSMQTCRCKKRTWLQGAV